MILSLFFLIDRKMSIFFAYAHANGIDGSCWFMIYEDVLKKAGAVEF